MEAIVLVGGLGTRLRPLTETIPKQLLPVAGVAMIERVLESLGAHGVERAVLSMGYLPDPFIAAYPDRRIAGVEVDFAVEPHPLDTAGAISFAARTCGVADTFLAVNGDVLTDLDVSALVALHRTVGAEATVALTEVMDPSRFGVVVTDDDGLVTDYVEKPEGKAPSNHVNAGTYVLEPSILDRIEPDVRVSIERDVFPKVVAVRRLFGRLDAAYWLDAGTPLAYLRANTDALDGTRSVACPGRLVDGSLLLEGAVVDATASVSCSVIGRGAVVRARAEVRGSVVLDAAEVGESATVAESIVGPGAHVGAGAAVEANYLVAEGASVPDHSRLRGAGATS